jgi:hypothetical protein
VDPEGEVRADVAQRRCGVEVSTRQVETVAGLEHLVDHRRGVGSCGDSFATVGPRLVAQWRGVDGFVDAPALAAGDLEHEDVVHVVVVVEATGLRRSDVSVDLHGMAEVGRELLGEVDERRPGPVQCLEHERRAVGEQRRELGVVHLVGDARTDAAGTGEVASREGGALLGHPDERGSQAPA